MFFHLAIHQPYADQADMLIDSMRRYAAAMQGQPGLRGVYTLRDQKSGALVGLAIWDSKEDWQAARPALAAAVQDDDFASWEPGPPEVFHLEPV